MPEQWISGNRSMDTVRRPLCGCFVLSCMVGGIFRKPLGFRRCLPPARPEKAWPFQAGRSPCTKHPRLSSFAFTPRKKFLRVPRCVFSKTHPWQGVGQGPTKRESEPAHRGTPFQAGRSLCTKHPRLSGLAFTHQKKFLSVPMGVFQKLSLAGSGTVSHREKIQACSAGCAFSGGTKTHRGERGDITLSAFHSALYRDLPQRNSSYGR